MGELAREALTIVYGGGLLCNLGLRAAQIQIPPFLDPTSPHSGI